MTGADGAARELTTAELGDLAAAYGWWKAHGDPEAFYDLLNDAVADRLAALTQDRDEFVAAAVARRNEAVAALAERDEARAVVEAIRADVRLVLRALLRDGRYYRIITGPPTSEREWLDVFDAVRRLNALSGAGEPSPASSPTALLPEPETSEEAETTCEGCGGTGVTQESHDGGTHPVHCGCTYGRDEARKVWLSDREYVIDEREARP